MVKRILTARKLGRTITAELIRATNRSDKRWGEAELPGTPRAARGDPWVVAGLRRGWSRRHWRHKGS